MSKPWKFDVGDRVIRVGGDSPRTITERRETMGGRLYRMTDRRSKHTVCAAIAESEYFPVPPYVCADDLPF